MGGEEGLDLVEGAAHPHRPAGKRDIRMRVDLGIAGSALGRLEFEAEEAAGGTENDVGRAGPLPHGLGAAGFGLAAVPLVVRVGPPRPALGGRRHGDGEELDHQPVEVLFRRLAALLGEGSAHHRAALIDATFPDIDAYIARIMGEGSGQLGSFTAERKPFIETINRVMLARDTSVNAVSMRAEGSFVEMRCGREANDTTSGPPALATHGVDFRILEITSSTGDVHRVMAALMIG